ncbi:hypothetical protein ACHAXA_011169 [Cyclostephanos tholiformis]|uniref:NAD(P)-binding domain-containing protein n=1 Tax=Cyclostephanos tholiformis TaxID=382380 RepID=A0ABD3RIP7_9STRA
MTSTSGPFKLVVLYGIADWDCGCIGGHTNPFDDPAHATRLHMIKIDDAWVGDVGGSSGTLAAHFEGASGVISCLGHRQPGWKYPELIRRGLISHVGNARAIEAMQIANVNRAVVVTSIALNNGSTKDAEWPHWAWSIMSCLFRTFQRESAMDLRRMEASYVDSSLDYLFVRPVGISEDRVPVGRYYLQIPGEKKSIDVAADGEIIDGIVGGNMAKMDVARFMVDEAIRPTFHRTSRVVGSKPGSPM